MPPPPSGRLWESRALVLRSQPRLTPRSPRGLLNENKKVFIGSNLFGFEVLFFSRSRGGGGVNYFGYTVNSHQFEAEGNNLKLLIIERYELVKMRIIEGHI